MKKENLPTWICDRCGKSKESQKKPSTMHDAWSYLKIDQDAGWDQQGCAWARRMREPILLCGECTGVIISVINHKCRGVELGPGEFTGCDGLSNDCPECGK